MNRKLFLAKCLNIFSLILIFSIFAGAPIIALARVWTEPTDYPPGSEV